MGTSLELESGRPGRLKFLIGGGLILAAVVYLIASSTTANAQFFLTIDELVAGRSQYADRNVRVSGAVDGESIVYEPATLTLSFTVAHVPSDIDEVNDAGGLAAVLHEAISDPTRSRIQVVYVGPKPDLLRHEAQAIMTGSFGSDGIFYAEELLLKCPTRYEEASPVQVDS